MTTTRTRRCLQHAMHLLFVMVTALALPGAAASAATLTFTVTANEPVIVTGTPRIAIDVGGVTRYATYASGSGTSALSFSYAVQPGDFDANGIALTSPLQLNGGTMTDGGGNPATDLAFTLPDTSALKVQTYTTAFTTSPITSSNANAVGFTIAKAPTGAAFTYTLSSSGGIGTVTGSGTIASSNHAVSGIDVSGLAAGTLTLSVTLSTGAGGSGAARTATATPTLSGAFDSLPAAAVAYSVRRLLGSYTGPLLRVRRSGDGASADIGATIGGDLDATALASFCGASSCFVSTWYDQSGNAQDATQAVAASQPRLVNAGAMETEGGRPALHYTAAGQVLVAAPVPGQTTQVTIDAVARSTNATVNRHVLGDRNAGGGRLIRAVAGGGSYIASNINVASVTMPGSTQQQRIVIMFAGGANLSGSLDGNVSFGAPTSGFFPVSVSFGVGGPGGSTGDWIGTISEVAMFNATLTTANRQSLERSQGAYYGISVP